MQRWLAACFISESSPSWKQKKNQFSHEKLSDFHRPFMKEMTFFLEIILNDNVSWTRNNFEPIPECAIADDATEDNPDDDGCAPVTWWRRQLPTVTDLKVVTPTAFSFPRRSVLHYLDSSSGVEDEATFGVIGYKCLTIINYSWHMQT